MTRVPRFREVLQLLVITVAEPVHQSSRACPPTHGPNLLCFDTYHYVMRFADMRRQLI
jgi:hypothetical protein